MAISRVRANEQSTKVIEFDLVDQDGGAVSSAMLTEATLTLLDIDTYVSNASPAEGIINDRDGQDVLNTNNVVIDTAGHVTWTMQADDNVIVTPRRLIERHRAEFALTWSLGEFRFQCEIEVVNLRKAS